MAANYDLIALLEQFWTCKRRNGYVVRAVVKKSVVIARIAEINPVTNDRYDRIIKLERIDVNGKSIPETTFKLSDLLSVDESVMLQVVPKA